MADLTYGNLSPVLSALKAFRDDAEAALAAGSLTFEQFVALQREWSAAAFGPSPPRGPAGPLKHLAKEVPEALAVVAELDRLSAADFGDADGPAQIADARDRLLTELVDCQFLILDAVWRAGFGPADLRRALGRKLVVNRARKWPKMAPDVAVEHDRSADDATATEHR